MEVVLQDLRYALRALRRTPGFTAIALITLALGIGANSAIFTVVNGVLLRALPYEQPDQLFRVDQESRDNRMLPPGTFSVPDFADFRASTTSVFSGVAGFFHVPAQTTMRWQGTGRAEHLSVAYVSGDFFRVMGVPASRGRVLSTGDDVVGRDRVAVLSTAAWRNHFSADPAIIGSSIRMNGEPYTVVGVMPAAFAYPHPDVEVWAPLSLLGPDAVGPLSRGNRWFNVIARAKPGVSEATIASTSSQVLARLEQDYPETNKSWGSARVRGLQDVLVGDVKPALLVLLGVVALVLLIACANLANLLLARSTTRAREIAVRTALGAGRDRIIRLVLTESLVLALVGGVAGFALSLWATRVLVLMAGDTIPRAESIHPDLNVVLFTIGLTLLTGVVFGLAPALRAASGAMAGKLREGGRSGAAGQERQRARSALVMIESALAVVLLVSAGLMIKSFYRLTQVDDGFQSESTVRIHLTMPLEILDDRANMVPRMTAYMQKLFDGLQTVPGVVSVGASKTVPLQGGAEPYPFAVPGGVNQDALLNVGAYIVSPGFFQTLGIPLLRGRDFAWSDQPAGLVVSRSLAERLWPGEDAIGKRLLLYTRSIEVIGVAGDVKNEGVAVQQTSAVYVPMYASPRSNQNIFVRVRGNPDKILPALREAVWSVDPNQAIRHLQTMQAVKSENVARPQFFMTLIAVFGGLALVLAAVGMYGVISYTMRQRTAEIGVRMALGADALQVYKLVVGKAMQLALVGVAAGLVGALVLTQLMRSLLFGVAPTDVLSLAGAALALTFTAFLAAFLPARRASRIPPSVAFRSE